MRHVNLVWSGCSFSSSKKAWREFQCYSQKVEMKRPMNMIEELIHSFSCAYIELWMHLGSLESTQEASFLNLYNPLEEVDFYFRLDCA